MSEILQALLSWPLLLVALGVYGFFPGLAARLISLCFRKSDPRRKELIAEVYAVPRWERPIWVAEQLERAISEGLWERIYDAADGRLFNRWNVESGVAMNAKYPDSFWVPSAEEIHTLEPGDFVKLLFAPKGLTHDEPSAERMWVKITKIRGDKFEGTLANQSVCFGHLDWGKRIKFSSEHIIDYDYNYGDDDSMPAGDMAA